MGAQLIFIWMVLGKHLQVTMSKVTLKQGIQVQGQPPNKVRHSRERPRYSGKGLFHFALSSDSSPVMVDCSLKEQGLSTETSF